MNDTTKGKIVAYLKKIGRGHNNAVAMVENYAQIAIRDGVRPNCFKQMAYRIIAIEALAEAKQAKANKAYNIAI